MRRRQAEDAILQTANIKTNGSKKYENKVDEVAKSMTKNV